MRVAFAGTPPFAVRALRAILDRGFSIPLVLTRPDKPKGRGLQLLPSPVAIEAAVAGLRVQTPVSLAGVDTALIGEADVLVVAAYGLILPRNVLAWPRHGCLNIHASLLPRWRGAAPIERAIEAGDKTTGITIMQMDAGLDTGPIVDTTTVAIDARETGSSLHDKLAAVGSAAIVQTLDKLEREGVLRATPQPTEGVTYAAKIAREETVIDWSLDAVALDRRIRAFEPTPGMQTSFGDVMLKVRRAEPVSPSVAPRPGRVVSIDREGIVVGCGRGALRLIEVQPAGGRRMSADAFAAGRSVEPGRAFGPTRS